MRARQSGLQTPTGWVGPTVGVSSGGKVGLGATVGGGPVASTSTTSPGVPVRFWEISVGVGESPCVTQSAEAMSSTAKIPAMAARSSPDGRDDRFFRATEGGTFPGGGDLGGTFFLG